jgi:hypothetical protein
MFFSYKKEKIIKLKKFYKSFFIYLYVEVMVKYKNPRNNKTNKELVRVDERENKIPRPPAWFSS